MPSSASESFWASARSSHRLRTASRTSALPAVRRPSEAQGDAPSFVDDLAGGPRGLPPGPGLPLFCCAMYWSVLSALDPAAGPPAGSAAQLGRPACSAPWRAAAGAKALKGAAALPSWAGAAPAAHEPCGEATGEAVAPAGPRAVAPKARGASGSISSKTL
eukprot:7532076-Lingulodinium_polyedra.AAC.2